jgi:pimeloyl-ACP methyl ester carboxylesterase
MSTVVDTRVVQTREGGELCLEMAGDDRLGTVLLCAGTPNSRHIKRRWVDDAVQRGLRIVGYDRPGYGRSMPRPGLSIADGAGHAHAIADALGVDRLLVWGYSGGGPYALACAALLPDLVAAAAVVGCPAPYGAPGLDYLDGTGDRNREESELLLSDREAARKQTRADWEEFLKITPDEFLESWGSVLSSVDRAVMTAAYAEEFLASAKDGLSPGDQGWWDDDLAQMSPWGFELASIRIPVKVWHGRHDRFVPFQHGQWLAEHIPGAEAELSETDGHLTLLAEKIPALHEWLVGHL